MYHVNVVHKWYVLCQICLGVYFFICVHLKTGGFTVCLLTQARSARRMSYLTMTSYPSSISHMGSLDPGESWLGDPKKMYLCLICCFIILLLSYIFKLLTSIYYLLLYIDYTGIICLIKLTKLWFLFLGFILNYIRLFHQKHNTTQSETWWHLKCSVSLFFSI